MVLLMLCGGQAAVSLALIGSALRPFMVGPSTRSPTASKRLGSWIIGAKSKGMAATSREKPVESYRRLLTSIQ
jgi:hypothetical protein